jgi:uncharacterized protein (DUF305 family)
MSESVVLDETEESDEVAPRPVALIRTLAAIIVVALLVIAGAVGWLIRGSGGGGTPTPSATSIDAGFAQDMATHHVQAVNMAGYARDNTTNPAVKNLAFDIETSQNFQVGEMQGWLDSWGLTRIDPTPMAWMGHADAVHNGLMPGMATQAQLTRFESLHGKALDILFLQLMIRHHQGGIPMARYASEHASEPYVRNLASSIVAAQSSELITMEHMLRQLGGQLLPPPQQY